MTPVTRLRILLLTLPPTLSQLGKAKKAIIEQINDHDQKGK
jgi:hypothetical protein